MILINGNNSMMLQHVSPELSLFIDARSPPGGNKANEKLSLHLDFVKNKIKWNWLFSS